MKTALAPVTLFLWLGLLGLTTTRAGEATDLLKGYGKVRWGQSLKEVREIYPNGAGSASAMDTDPRKLPPIEAQGALYTVGLPEPLDRICFEFADNQMCGFTLTFSERTMAVVKGQQVANELWKKYFDDPATRAAIEAQRIHMFVRAREGGYPQALGTVIKEAFLHPKEPGDLVYPTNGQDLEVTYKNQKLADEANAQAKERRQQAIKEAAGVSLRDVL